VYVLVIFLVSAFTSTRVNWLQLLMSEALKCLSPRSNSYRGDHITFRNAEHS